jgi:hypothetical protein
MASITVVGKVVGQRRPLFSDWELPMLPEWEQGVGHTTLRDLITQIVRAEVAAYLERQEQRSMIQALTQADIQRGLMKGKVDPGGREKTGTVDAEEAVQRAIQAFEDGLYYVFIDEEQQTDLGHAVSLHSDSRVTFLRLVALAGG